MEDFKPSTKEKQTYKRKRKGEEKKDWKGTEKWIGIGEKGERERKRCKRKVKGKKN
jgi:hypothetical protein